LLDNGGTTKVLHRMIPAAGVLRIQRHGWLVCGGRFGPSGEWKERSMHLLMMPKVLHEYSRVFKDAPVATPFLTRQDVIGSEIGAVRRQFPSEMKPTRLGSQGLVICSFSGLSGVALGGSKKLGQETDSYAMKSKEPNLTRRSDSRNLVFSDVFPLGNGCEFSVCVCQPPLPRLKLQGMQCGTAALLLWHHTIVAPTGTYLTY
jgi:hypothetical protein